MKCSIKIEETSDGKLVIVADIPKKLENSVAATLTRALLENAKGIMDTVTGQNGKIIETEGPKQ